MYNIRMIVEHGLYLTQVITNLEKRYRVKSKTSFANIFLIDDPWFYDGFIGVIFMIIAFPKYFYDKKLKDISVEFNISQSRISRIIQNALEKIKKELLKQEEVIVDEDNF